MAYHHILLATLCLISVLSPQPAFSQETCKSKTFSNKNITFENCNDLPTLNAILHWTYDPAQSSLSMAFTAPPSGPNGWVAWALNPTATGMVGAQSLIAYKPTPTGTVSVATYDIQSYHALVKGPISYNVTGLSAEESDGEITIFATWALPKGSTKVNQVWQVGPVVNGKVGKHEFDQANLESKMTLDLAGGPSGGPVGAPMGSPTEGPAPVSGSEAAGASAPGPATGGAVKSFGVTSLGVVLGALVASLF